MKEDDDTGDRIKTRRKLSPELREINRRLGNALNESRKSSGMSQYAVAKSLRTGATTLKHYYEGTRQIPFDFIWEHCQLTHVTVAALLSVAEIISVESFEDCLANDPNIDDIFRFVPANAYAVAIEETKKRRSTLLKHEQSS